jgi:hypothetical protein
MTTTAFFFYVWSQKIAIIIQNVVPNDYNLNKMSLLKVAQSFCALWKIKNAQRHRQLSFRRW